MCVCMHFSFDGTGYQRYVCVCVYVYMHVCMLHLTVLDIKRNTQIRTYTHSSREQSCVYIYTNMHIHTYTHIHTCTHTHARTHTHAHTLTLKQRGEEP